MSRAVRKVRGALRKQMTQLDEALAKIKIFKRKAIAFDKLMKKKKRTGGRRRRRTR